MNPTTYKVISKSVPVFNFSESVTPLAAVGATILMHSKIILLENIHFLLSHLDPHKAELLYLDTDSCYWAVHHKNLADNVAPHMKNSYEQNKNSYVDSTTLLAGYLIRQAGGGVHLITETKHILNGVQPKKRFFIHSQHSYTY